MVDTCRVDIRGVEPVGGACHHKEPEAGSCRAVDLHAEG